MDYEREIYPSVDSGVPRLYIINVINLSCGVINFVYECQKPLHLRRRTITPPMNLQQLEYIVALDVHRNHARAAAHCNVSQPTLSMMVKKLEGELGIKIFERGHPLKPSSQGEIIISRARQILLEVRNLREFVRNEKESIEGEFRLGVIPTLAPYLLPRFVNDFLAKHPQTSFTVVEMHTEEMIRNLKSGRLDVGILVTPLDDKEIREVPIFYEPILLYTSQKLKYYDQAKVSLKSLSTDNLLLLEEGHCFRGQVMNLCPAKGKPSNRQLNYQSGSFETLKAMVDNDYGYTLIPELAVDTRKKQVKRFLAPEPVREVSLVVHARFVKDTLIARLRDAILKAIPAHFRKSEKYVRIRWD